jgi:hypothetical protein
VLKLRVPKPETHRPRRVEIKASDGAGGRESVIEGAQA